MTKTVNTFCGLKKMEQNTRNYSQKKTKPKTFVKNVKIKEFTGII